ncbi:hypothetical protein M9H77_31336 [Catharanthus roseus]|uniref:Uncharacterized protein n=1 Tax=Catharanthus roseus TaxID=4058 RepID=A0ACC0A1V6_CATRO|nr:hypothetical protein M9H77_31336 [Catharanthus roseus]
MMVCVCVCVKPNYYDVLKEIFDVELTRTLTQKVSWFHCDWFSSLDRGMRIHPQYKIIELHKDRRERGRSRGFDNGCDEYRHRTSYHESRPSEEFDITVETFRGSMAREHKRKYVLSLLPLSLSDPPTEQEAPFDAPSLSTTQLSPSATLKMDHAAWKPDLSDTRSSSSGLTAVRLSSRWMSEMFDEGSFR